MRSRVSASMDNALDILLAFQKLGDCNSFRITSPRTPIYNCIAWAAGEEVRWWWPDAMGVNYWPKEVIRETTLNSFIRAYETVGYRKCDHSELESDFEKLAIFTKPAGTPAHAARQLPNGKWTSKLGNGYDIEHELRGVEGRGYGSASVVSLK